MCVSPRVNFQRAKRRKQGSIVLPKLEKRSQLAKNDVTQSFKIIGWGASSFFALLRTTRSHCSLFGKQCLYQGSTNVHAPKQTTTDHCTSDYIAVRVQTANIVINLCCCVSPLAWQWVQMWKTLICPEIKKSFQGTKVCFNPWRAFRSHSTE